MPLKQTGFIWIVCKTINTTIKSGIVHKIPASFSIVICTYNRADYLNNLLLSFRDMDNQIEQDYELLIIDNNSTDKTGKIVDSWKGRINCSLSYYLEKKQGTSYARNRAVRESRCDWLWFVDDDIIFDRDWLSGVSKALDKYHEASAIAGRIMPVFEDGQPEWIPVFALDYYGLTRFGDNCRWLNEGEYPIAGNAAFKRTIFDKVGLFNTSLGRVHQKLISWDETELCMRIYKSGLKIAYTPDTLVHHIINKKRTTRGWLIRRIYSDGKSQVISEVAQGKYTAEELKVMAKNRLQIEIEFNFDSQLKYVSILKNIRIAGIIVEYAKQFLRALFTVRS